MPFVVHHAAASGIDAAEREDGIIGADGMTAEMEKDDPDRSPKIRSSSDRVGIPQFPRRQGDGVQRRGPGSGQHAGRSAGDWRVERAP